MKLAPEEKLVALARLAEADAAGAESEAGSDGETGEDA